MALSQSSESSTPTPNTALRLIDKMTVDLESMKNALNKIETKTINRVRKFIKKFSLQLDFCDKSSRKLCKFQTDLKISTLK